MAASIEILKKRLRGLLLNPQSDEGFRAYFASLLIDLNDENDAQMNDLVHSIDQAFSDARKGLLNRTQLREALENLSAPAPVEATKIELFETREYSPNQISILFVKAITDDPGDGSSQGNLFKLSGSQINPWFSSGSYTATCDVYEDRNSRVA